MAKFRKVKNSSENMLAKDLKKVKKDPTKDLKKVKKEVVKGINNGMKVSSKNPKSVKPIKNLNNVKKDDKKDFKKVEKKPEKNIKNKKEYSNNKNSFGDNSTEEENVIDLKRAKLEVLQFGLRGLKGDDKEKGLVDMLVGLGAKPPKNKHINYKVFQQQKAEEKKKELELRKSMEQFGGNLLKKLPKEYKKKTRSDLNLGRIKDGFMKVPRGLNGQKMKDVVKKSK